MARESFSSLEFYVRRVKRIFPALIAVLLAASVLGWLTLLSDQYQRLGRDISEGAGFISNIAYYWHNDPEFHASRSLYLDHLWSLGVEEQFYLLWPPFLMLMWKLKSRQFVLITTLTAISFAINVIEISQGANNYSLPWARLWQLSLGGILAYMQAHRAADLERLRSAFSMRYFSWVGLHNNHVRGLVGAALIVASFVGLKDTSAFPGWKALAPTLGALLVIAAGAKGCVNRYVLATTPLVTIGLISYPIYLWHYIFLQIARLISPQITPMMTVAAIIAAFIFSFITYKYVELPLRYSPNTNLIASALCVAMLACGILGYAMVLGDVPARTEPLDVKDFALASTEDWLPDTHGIPWTRGSDQFLALGAGSRSVLYIGDSNMQQYYQRIAKVLADHPLNKRGAVFAARDWCAPVDFDIPNSHGATSPACRHFMRRAFEYARGSRIDSVVISACWRCYLLSLDDSLGRSSEVDTSSRRALESLQREMESVVRAGKRVYVVLGIPTSVDLDPSSLIHRTIVPPGFRVVISSPRRSDLEKSIESIRSSLITVAQATGASVIDPMQSLCDQTTCSPVSLKGQPAYHDWFNLSPSYVRENVQFLDKTILNE
jgi:peptidoglycan/LPS O-acetylase OafA/YrhL